MILDIEKIRSGASEQKREGIECRSSMWSSGICAATGTIVIALGVQGGGGKCGFVGEAKAALMTRLCFLYACSRYFALGCLGC